MTIGEDYPETGNDLLLVGVLKGAVMFMTDLARALPVPVQLEQLSFQVNVSPKLSLS